MSKLISLVFLNHPEIPDSQASATRGSNRVLITDLHHSLYLHGNTAPQILQPTFFSGISESSHVGSPMCIQTIGSLFIPTSVYGNNSHERVETKGCALCLFSLLDLLVSPHSPSPTPIGDLNKAGSLQVSSPSTCT